MPVHQVNEMQSDRSDTYSDVLRRDDRQFHDFNYEFRENQQNQIVFKYFSGTLRRVFVHR